MTCRVPLDTATLARAAAVLQAGGTVIFPTETFYGMAVDARNEAAVARLCRIKDRRDDAPLPVLVDSLAMVAQVAGELPAGARALAGHFWPGPLTLVVPAREGLPAALTAGGTTIGLRIPGLAAARELVRRAGFPITATSANRSGDPPVAHAAELDPDLAAAVDLVLDDGTTPGGRASTVVDTTGEQPVILRPGPVEEAQIRAVWKEARRD